ncbi:peptide chain release factor N(5)-glutamine methyltransferase [Sinorhizobium numidicum]|uniref:Peptide chain release factor N(5)-glutamine methyltransferase n=1 Tax=Sinorhizobium numidicum TaxID=680248 RepID=A0ABY8CVA5_9HYPH|nr:peptide chain release factor N(5)-glutamine methyltransferase [Sinorhizobium numidicum]WEX74928.1 peptide chain release factor N(5)-glutamine methyltransferase [Sinorhizobium numidicum]WEX80921.1 peptide chain release factor N(5)-glutamine methyltransferase [Sinorhizobium numidicum]
MLQDDNHFNGSPADDHSPRLHRFMGVELELAPDVLVPRQETELLGRSAVAILRDHIGQATVIDMCCGSGNLALAIATEIPLARVWGADLTDSTVALARRNIERLGLGERVFIRQGDLFAALEGENFVGSADVIVCNPPYISTSRLESDSAHLLKSEPRAAFDGGPYGISIHQRLIREAVTFLKPGGWLLFEFGEGQDRQAAALLARTKAYETVAFAHDAAGEPRVALVRKLGGEAPATDGSEGERRNR